jgi:hypothetical protein
MRGLWRGKHANGKSAGRPGQTGSILPLARFGWGDSPRLFAASLLEKARIV